MDADTLGTIRQALADNTNGSTHWGNCYPVHPWCAVSRLLDELAAEQEIHAACDARKDAEVGRLRAVVDRRDACCHGIVTECRECGYARFIGDADA